MKGQIFNYEPHLTSLDKKAAQKSLLAGIANPSFINNFESYVSSFLDRPVISCNSGTSALHLSLLAMEIQPGDEIICPSTTFAASWNVIKYLNACPVFVDIDKHTWCIDTNAIEQKITKKTKAIISVDLHGNPCDYKSLHKICNKYNINLISDPAGAVGAYYNGNPLGCLADITCLSMNLNKIITSNGGGIISLGENFKCKEEKIRQLLNQSFISSKKEGYDYSDVGFNYRFNAVSAGIAMSQFERLPDILQKKKEINSIYQDNLSEKCSFQEPTENSLPNNWMNTVVFNTKSDRNKVHQHLRHNLIESRLTYKPVNEIQWLKEKIKEKFKNSKYLYDRALSLPSGITLNKKHIDFICKQVIIALDKSDKR